MPRSGVSTADHAGRDGVGGGSITAAPSLRARVLEAERWRIRILMGCLGAVLLTWIIRRMLHGGDAAADRLFLPISSVLVAGLAILALAFFEVTWRMKMDKLLPWWRLVLGAIVDLGVPFGILMILHVRSPRGELASLSAPALLIVPIVIMLSVLRLRPRYSLLIGIGAAALHWMLASDAVRSEHVDGALIPQLFSYGVLLAFTGGAAAAMSTFVRGYIREAAREAEAAVRASGQLAAVEHELGIAREIQQGLLPSEPPKLPGFDIAGMARPAAHAGGDYYDWQMLPDGRLVVAIADVTGHGIGPALVMAVCRAYARATAPRAQDAAEFLERINELIVNDVSNGRFITMAVAVVHPDATVDLLSAGHGPTFHYRRADGGFERFYGNGLPLGVIEDERYGATHRIKLEPGDLLVMMTDGFTERGNPASELMGAERLATAIKRHAHQTASELIASIDAETTAFAAGAAQKDDMTMVVVRRV